MDIDYPSVLPGLTILIGLTYYDHEDRFISQEQLFGVIQNADAKPGILIKLSDGGDFILPPDFKAILDAPRGEYHCVASGETIVNPDLLTSWKIQYPVSPDLWPHWSPNYAPFAYSTVPPEWKFTYKPDLNHNRKMIEMKGERYIGKHVLIGSRHFENQDGEERFVRQEQLHGDIIRVTYSEGIVISFPSGSEYTLPPDLSMFEPAPQGEYTLTSTGEVVINPDFLTTWTLTSPTK